MKDKEIEKIARKLIKLEKRWQQGDESAADKMEELSFMLTIEDMVKIDDYIMKNFEK